MARTSRDRTFADRTRRRSTSLTAKGVRRCARRKGLCGFVLDRSPYAGFSGGAAASRGIMKDVEYPCGYKEVDELLKRYQEDDPWK